MLWINPLVWIKMRTPCINWKLFFASRLFIYSISLSLPLFYSHIYLTLCLSLVIHVLFMNLILCNWNNSRVKQLREHTRLSGCGWWWWVIATSFTHHLMQFIQNFANDFVKSYSFMERSVRERIFWWWRNENVGNAKLESEKLIQQVFIMHACKNFI